MAFKKQTLKNDLRVITVPFRDATSVTVLALFATGSKYEAKEINGLSHFLEHMMFKGTKKRPTTLSISEELDGVGGFFNAFTGEERTGYWVKVDWTHLDLALDIVSDMLLNSKFDKKEMDKERGVIIEEMNMVKDNPRRHVWDLLGKLMYGDQPAGRDILGTKEIISTVSREELVRYYKSQYGAGNMVLIVSGKFDQKAILGKINKYFTRLNLQNPQEKPKVVENQHHPEILINSKQTDQTHWCLSFRAFDIFDKRRFALAVLSLILGEGMSSRLFIRIREKQGLAYTIHSGTDHSTDTGCLAIYAGVGNDKVKKALEETLDEIKKIKTKGITDAELKKAKDNFKGKTLIGLETSDEWASFVGGQEIITRKIMTPEEVLKKINKVTRRDILGVAREVFQNEKMNLALIGPFKDRKIFDDILKI
ncbi:hypothetical protein A2907_02195 [Candidatus Azambacteria bacterium RIFCSPLOWO2_01_FULL_37_9]|uniref:Peptidase M16 n=1 Tax=Candidatus Azambacteria bacterium RIFCSPLOWO2_01_FULL_37_9 TaxID=1797297 RepID=A0A1F5C8C5_9BACT|nr:MAG: Processing protease [Parcubacteria group bacterium GW2011_GWE2_37_8]KKQ59546.1 MAG: Processing protease [Parcubacteria group bacterium GW2011_GWD1_38_16]OGD39117.1 MAG: hypothetical protein A2907_02195 [Candidatus Azambacteria bacterium RIFCSPLOWO2_01_FULL_37_9]